MSSLKIISGLGALVILFGVLSSFFTVDQTQQALVLQFGEPKRLVNKPGLNFKIPFIQEVTYFEKRVLSLVSQDSEEVILADQKRLEVDTYSRFRITDPLLFYQTVRNEFGARQRLESIIDSSVRRVFGKFELTAILSDARTKIVEDIGDEVNSTIKKLGMEIVDVRIRRVDLPAENEESIYARMEAERKRQANKYRSEGEEEAQKIRAATDRDKTIILADSYKEAERLRGEGDAKAVNVYARSYSSDPKFYEFVRTLDAYKKVVDDKTTLVLPSNSRLFKLLMGK